MENTENDNTVEELYIISDDTSVRNEKWLVKARLAQIAKLELRVGVQFLSVPKVINGKQYTIRYTHGYGADDRYIDVGFHPKGQAMFFESPAHLDKFIESGIADYRSGKKDAHLMKFKETVSEYHKGVKGPTLSAKLRQEKEELAKANNALQREVAYYEGWVEALGTPKTPTVAAPQTIQ